MIADITIIIGIGRTDLRLWNRHNGVVAVKGYVRKGGENMGKIIGGGYGGGDGYGYGDGGGYGYGDGGGGGDGDGGGGG